jgi:putative tributyrin esterase
VPRFAKRTADRICAVLVFVFAVWLTGCRKVEVPQRAIELPVGTALHDRTFHSEALGRDETYRVIAPSSVRPGERLHVVYLLHGNGQSFREWSERPSIAQLTTQGYVLVMPEGHSSYFMNSASDEKDRYEDFITHDLVADAEGGLPVKPDRADRSIIGVSMGGFAAVVLSLKHPGLYGFAGALSPPVDMPRRAFTLRRLSQSLGIRSIFGPSGSAARAANDPFILAKNANPSKTAYLFLSVGEPEPLLDPVSHFDGLLRARGIPHEFHTQPGGHDWQQWNRQLPALMSPLETR